MPLSHVHLSPSDGVAVGAKHPLPTQLRGLRQSHWPTGEGGCLSRRSFPTSFNSPCDLLAKPGLLGVCVPRTSTFHGQLFHHGLASTRSYARTAHRLPA